jgi:hypothetical protein
LRHWKRILLSFSWPFLPIAVFAQTAYYDDAMKKVAWSIENKLSDNLPIVILKFDSSSERFSTRIINDLTGVFINDGITVFGEGL